MRDTPLEFSTYFLRGPRMLPGLCARNFSMLWVRLRGSRLSIGSYDEAKLSSKVSSDSAARWLCEADSEEDPGEVAVDACACELAGGGSEAPADDRNGWWWSDPWRTDTPAPVELGTAIPSVPESPPEAACCIQNRAPLVMSKVGGAEVGLSGPSSPSSPWEPCPSAPSCCVSAA